MAGNSLITEALSTLQAVTSPADTDLIPVGTSNGETMKKLTFANLVSSLKSKLKIEDTIYENNYRRVKKFTSSSFALEANITKNIDVSISVPVNPTAVVAVQRGGMPFMVSVNTTSMSNIQVACRSTTALTNRTIDVIVFY